MLDGRKTYIVAFVMLAHAISGYFLGDANAHLDVAEVLQALGLAALRNGVSK